MKIINLLLMFVILAAPFASAETDIMNVKWQNFDESISIRNGESASFFYRIASFDAPIQISLNLMDSNNQIVSNILTKTISENELKEQGYTYTSSAIKINPENYNSKPGSYKVAININDKQGFSEENKKILDLEVTGVSLDNNAPIAVITVFPAETVNVNTPVTLSGEDSHDVEGPIAEYEWKQISGNQAFEFNNKASSIIVTPSVVGRYEFILKVKDSQGVESAIADKVITVTDDVNLRPVALFISPDKALVNEQIEFDASLSRDDGKIVSYDWEILKESNGNFDEFVQTLSGEKVSYIFSDISNYKVRLVVTDDEGATSPEFSKKIEIYELTKNAPPVALFNLPAEARTGSIVQFDASPSYDDNKIVEYKWEAEGKTFFGKLVSYVFTTAKEFIVKLTVTDDEGASSTLEKAINIRDDFHPGENLAPIANAGIDQSVNVNSVVTLDGSSSYDPDGDDLSYSWTQMEGSLVKLEGSATKNPRFTTEKPGRYKFSLVVIDDKGGSSQPDEVLIMVQEEGQTPQPEEVSKEIHKFTVTSVFVKEDENRLDVYAKVRNRGNNREDVLISATILPTGEYASTRTIADMKENSYEVLSLSKPQEPGSYIVKIDVSNRKDRDIYYLPIEV